MACWEVFTTCERCKKAVHGAADFDESGTLVATSMFYMRPAYQRFMRKGEVQICDACMQADEAYQKEQGLKK
jgi:hypothetical protein